MNKPRRVVVISPRSYNERHGTGPGRCIAVPFTATCPRVMSPAIIHFPLGVVTGAIRAEVIEKSRHGSRSADLAAPQHMQSSNRPAFFLQAAFSTPRRDLSGIQLVR
jgi:hypothetical protein